MHTSVHKTSANRITRREREVLRLLCQGLSCPEVAERLFISAETVKSHRKSLFVKLDVRTGVQLGAVAAQLFSIKTSVK